MMIARYVAGMSINIDRKSVAAVDKTLNELERKLKKFGKFTEKTLKIKFDIAKFNVDQKMLEKVLGDSLDRASSNTTFEVSRFTLNHRNLQSAMMRAARSMPAMPVNTRGGVNRSQGANVVQQVSQASPRSQSSHSRANYLHAGGSAGAFARYGVASLPFVGGVYGLGQANSMSQELQANELALNAVAGGNAQRYREYLSGLGDKLGMTTRDLQPGFTQYLASAQGTALESNIQGDFSSFTQYGAVMGLKPEDMKGSLRAITQMVSKQQIYAEELKGQLAERMPAAVRLMADAVTGGDTKALLKMMEDGKLDPNEALPKFFSLMKDRSDPMLPSYFETSRFAQGSMNKEFEDQFKIFAKEGGDRGFTRLFKSMTAVMKEATPTVEGLARGFDELSKYVSFAMLLPQSFKRAFEGRDSWVADMLGKENIKIIEGFTTGLGQLTEEIKNTLKGAFEGWGMIFEEFGPELMSFLVKIKDIFLYTFKMLNAFLPGGGGLDAAANYGKAMTASLNGASPEEVRLIAEGKSAGAPTTGIPPLLQATPPGMMYDTVTGMYKSIGEKTGITGFLESFSNKMTTRKGGNVDSSEYQREMAMARQQGQSGSNQLNISPGAIVINAPTGDAQALSDTLMSTLKEQAAIMMTGQYSTALVSFPNTGS